MPRTLSSDLAATLQTDTTTLAVLIKLTLTDSTVMGFSSVDRDITYGGVTYQAGAAANISSFQQSLSGGVNNSEVSGLITSDRITEADIAAGRYDGAQYQVFVVDSANLSHGAMILESGFIGQITDGNGAFIAETRGKGQLLKQNIGEQTSASCRCRRLGDAQCKVDMTSYRVSATVTAVSSDGLTISFASGTGGVFDFINGVIKMTSGPNSGIERDIKDGNPLFDLILATPFPFPVSVGDTATLDQGCNKDFSTCFTRFNNAINFHGEPLLPGNDQIIQVGRYNA